MSAEIGDLKHSDERSGENSLRMSSATQEYSTIGGGGGIICCVVKAVASYEARSRVVDR